MPRSIRYKLESVGTVHAIKETNLTELTGAREGEIELGATDLKLLGLSVAGNDGDSRLRLHLHGLIGDGSTLLGRDGLRDHDLPVELTLTITVDLDDHLTLTIWTEADRPRAVLLIDQVVIEARHT